MTHMRHFCVFSRLSRGSPGRCAFFGALDDEEFFVIEGSLGVALTPGVVLPHLLDRSCVDRHMR